jgi:predicted ATP-grasp superfamily ATP-dependent carboligase
MFRVLVFPSCNEPGLEIINSLSKSNKVTLYGGSSYNLEFDPSRVILRNHIKCPDYYSEDFADKFKRILEENRIDIVFPTMDILVAEFSKWSLPGVTFITCNPETAELFLSKSRTYERLRNVVPVPRIYYDSSGDIELPVFAKPDVGSGSRSSRLICTKSQLNLAREEGLLITEFLPGEEFTVDCINDLHGRLLFYNVRIRGHVGRGISLGTSSKPDLRIETYVRNIAKEVRIEGPWFAQFKVDRSGEPKLMEVNCRVAGSMTLTRLSGVNIPLLAVFLYMGFAVEVPRPIMNIRLNRCLRNFGEMDDFAWLIWDLDDTILRKDGKPDPDVIACMYDCNNRGKKQILLTKNEKVEKLLEIHHIPHFFVEVCYTRDKVMELRRILSVYSLEANECVMVNDSIMENLMLQKEFPNLRILRPDSLELLGKERV